MAYQTDRPLMVQSDMSVLLEVHHAQYEEVRSRLSVFAELEKSPEHIHTYRMTPISLWNAAAAGMKTEEVLTVLREYSKFEVASNVLREIQEYFQRYGMLRLVKEDDQLFLTSHDAQILNELFQYRSMRPYVKQWVDEFTAEIDPFLRGRLKQEMMNLGYPVKDLAGYTEGTPLSLAWRLQTLNGGNFTLRPYQQSAAESFYAEGSVYGGSGVLVLPCGAGKTVIGLAAAVQIQAEVLVLTSSVIATRQWIREFLDKTTILPEQIGEYSGDCKEIRPITVATYQILSYRKDKTSVFEHLSLFNERNWGLIIYDEVHLLPAPVFRITADIQAKRRLGLTATLVREDGKEKDVFSLIGPKKYDAPWKTLENQGWIATAVCKEIRVELSSSERRDYALSDSRSRARLAAEASVKCDVVLYLVDKHRGDQILIIGQYLDQLEHIADQLQAPLITGKMKHHDRDELFQAFREGRNRLLVVSKVANFAIDLPDANVAVQVSGQFGSRQEEAQRLGRILRPKKDGGQAHFYSVITKNTKDHDFAVNRQRFLTEQGYQYIIYDAADLLPLEPELMRSPVMSWN